MLVMKLWRVLASLYLGFLLGGTLLLFFGASGLRSYRSLAAYRDILQKNIQELEDHHRSLAEERDALRTDPRRIALQARELGWFAKDERVVHLDSYTAVRDLQPVGRQVRRAYSEPHNATLLRVLCVSLPFGIYTALRLLRRRWQHAGRKLR